MDGHVPSQPEESRLDPVMPANESAERTLLGSVLLDNRCFDEIQEKLEAGDFFLDSHRRIFRRIAALINSDKAVDIVTLANELERAKELETIGGRSYLASLTEGLPFNLAVGSYAQIVRDKALLRQLMAISTSAIERASDQSEEASAIVADVEQEILSIAEKGIVQPLETFGTYVEKKYTSFDAIFETSARQQGLPTGFRELDDLTCGLQRKDLVVVAARPGMGKTSFGLSIALHASVLLGKVSAFFSIEMGKDAILQRALAIQGSLSLQDIREGRWTPTSRRYAMEALDQIMEAPFYIDDEPGLSLQRMKAKALRLKNQLGRLDLVVVDQLNHIPPPEDTRRLNRTDQVGAVTRGLKVIAKVLDAPVAVLHQLSRENLKREDKEPTLGDLRDSGNVEQDADVVIFPHRPGYYGKTIEERASRAAVLIVAKQRNGPVGRANCEFLADQTQYRDKQDDTQFKMFTGRDPG